MADPKKTPVPSKSKIMNILNKAAGLKDLSPNQRMLKLADMGKANVKNLIRLGGIKGAALTLAADVAMRMLPDATPAKKGGADPMGLMKPKAKAKDAPASETRRQKNQTSTPKKKPEYSGGQRKAAEKNKPIDKKVPGLKKSLRPKARPKNLKDGGMPMVMKDGKKVPEYAADGIGKMNKGGMAMKKPTTKMMAGGMAAKKKPAAKKMMAGGMAKKKMMAGGMTKSNYMYGGMAKKPKAKK